ncbi:unnamed protein product [Porites evermanni]|uniref:Transporter n=1 Tax=Porites evermanni TaxID=104178 RepID=A0ABN8M557_9CNID|nr:unnamed protein product [Porites evermanni]
MVDVVKEREIWSSKIDFILALMGYCIGLGNIWRFPYLCFKNGGGSFLIPYLICLMVTALPVTVLEVGLGQFTSQGAITAWNICPLLQGIGYASVLVVTWIIMYYLVVLAWSLFYLFASFQSTLPWSHCNNEWNTPNCVDHNSGHNQDGEHNNTFQNVTSLFNLTVANVSKRVPAIQEYWDYRVLRLSNGLNEPGPVNWDLALCLLLAWIICYLCVSRGIKTSGKVVYFTATAPYILITVLLIRAVTLPGAGEGIKFYLKPDWSRLKDGQVWLDAGTQVFYSYSIGMGGLIALGSYNKYYNNFYRDCIWNALCNSGTSVYGGFLIFSILGFMAKHEGVEVKDVVQAGPGLVFLVYPEAVAQMPLAPLWSALFFFMFLLLGLDSAFVVIESIITAIVDLFSQHLRRGYRKELFTALMCSLWFLCGLSMVTKGGMYVFQLFDAYCGAGTVLLLVVLGECLAIGWFYGRDRFYSNIEAMLGFPINPWCGWCWKYLSPTTGKTMARQRRILSAVFVFYLSTYQPLKYREYVYPAWGQAIGWLMTLSSLSLIPAVMICKLMNATGSIKERLRELTIPVLFHRQEDNETAQLIPKESSKA